MAHKDFAASRREAEREPVAFSLAGQRFACFPAGTTVVTAATFTLASRPLTGGTAQRFIEAVLQDGQQRRFRRTLAQHKRPWRRRQAVDIDLLLAIALWLVEVYTGRPTLRSNGSSVGPSTAGPTLNGQRAAPEATASS